MKKALDIAVEATKTENGEKLTRIRVGKGFLIYSQELCGRESVSVFGPESRRSNTIAYKGTIQLTPRVT
jgi:hypothetical protein